MVKDFENLSTFGKAINKRRVYCYRQDGAKRQTAGIKFTHRPKIRFFAPQERLVAPIQVKLGLADGHVGPLGSAKFRLDRQRGWECSPQNIKNFHFFVNSRPIGATLLTTLKFFTAFYTPHYPTLVFKFHVICIIGYGVIAEKPRVGKLGQIFMCTL